ncbi:hypothetical protein GYA19_03635 [Candidatus Beckwithbacteria bacterium]|nr:hypothetical protein [Candidatus Beckwithbacteria bacterium]
MDKGNKDLIELIIVNPDRIVFEGKAKRIFVPGKIQELAILPDHAPLYSELLEGEIIIEEENDKKTVKKIDGGILRIKNNLAKILVGF